MKFVLLLRGFIFFGCACLLLSNPAGAVTIGETTPLPEGRQFHGAAVLGDCLYVFGGATAQGGYTKSVFFSRIQKDGTAGSWQETTPLPAHRSYIDNSTLVLNDVVYIVGGADDQPDGYHTTAVYSKPNPDGMLGPWIMSSPFGSGGAAPAAVATPGFLHVTGGKIGKARISDEIWSARVLPDGTLSLWAFTSRLPKPLWYHNAGVALGRVYVWGGLTENNEAKIASSDVFSAPILSSGLLGEWRREQPLPTAFYGCPATVAGPYLLSFSPRVTGGQETNRVWFNFVTADGPTQWISAETPLPLKIYHAAATDYRLGTIYIPGGRFSRADTRPLPNVFFFVLGQKARDQYSGQTAAAAQERRAQPRQTASHSGRAISQFTFMADSELPPSALPGFKTIGRARYEATSGNVGKPLLVYFNNDVANGCKEQNQIIQGPNFEQLTQRAEFAWVDIRNYPQFAQQLGVWSVPTWVIFDRQGVMRGKHSGQVTLEQLANAVVNVN